MFLYIHKRRGFSIALGNTKDKGEIIMGQVTISTIQNEKLRKAAEKADANLNGSFDANEISLFMDEAVKNNCNSASIVNLVRQITNKQGSSVDVKTEEKLKLMTEITALENQLKKKENEIKQAYEKYNKMPGSKTERISTLSGMTVGAAAGLGLAGSMLMSAAAATPVGLAVAVGAGLFTALGSMFIGYGLGKITGKNIESHDEKIAQNDKDNYHKNVLEKLFKEADDIRGDIAYKKSQYLKLSK